MEPAAGQSVQRYYDPAVGRFLSYDPVAASVVTGTNFNRYWYANNNPSKYRDPDGRLACKSLYACYGLSVVTVSAGKGLPTKAQKDMVPVDSDGFSKTGAVEAVASAVASDPKMKNREPNSGIVRTSGGSWGYTKILWGEPHRRIVDVSAYTAALIAVYGPSKIGGLFHGHWDNNPNFSPDDVKGRGNWTYFLRNRNGQIRQLDKEIEEDEIDAKSTGDADKHMLIYGGFEGKCISNC